MPIDKRSRLELLAEIEDLRFRLLEAEETLEAIRSGEVDALVVSMPEGERIFTLQGAEQPYRILVEAMNEGAATLAPDGTIVYCNKRLATMLQVPLEKLVATSLDSYIAPDDYHLFAARLDKCTSEYDNEEITLLTGAGKRLPVLFSCCMVEFSGSQGMSVVFTDITARKQSEEIILRLNRLYAVLSATNHAIVHTNDPDSVFKEFCRVAVELGGFRLAWVGVLKKETELLEIVAASGKTEYVEDMRISVKESEPGGMGPAAISIREGTFYICNNIFENEFTRPWHGKARDCGLYASASIAFRQNQEVVGVLTLYAGETNFFDAQMVGLLQQMGSEVSFALDNFYQTLRRREAEQALQKETVERLLAVEELNKKEQLLIHQSRQAALGEMIGNIAHQWRQPLNALGLLVQQYALFYELGEFNKEFLDNNQEKAMKVIRHMSETIDDFRNFFKPDKEKLPFNVHEIVERSLSIMEGNFQGQQIAIDVEAKDNPVVHGYPNEFSQAVLNILMNAGNALAERKVAAPLIRIKIAAEGNRTVVRIADNAGGIPEGIINKIFDPYFTTREQQAGTGVGLFMSKTIIEKNMGGRLTAQNIGDGAEFRIEIERASAVSGQDR